MSDEKSPRLLKISILRFDPHDPEDVPHMETFEIEESYGMTLYIVLNQIREHHDNALKFDFVCRAGICGSCSMLVNGRPTLACRTLTSKLDEGMVEESKKLIESMGIPIIQASSEGEAQSAYMVEVGDAWACASQDYDTLLFGGQRLVRNFAINRM